jgi:urea transport system substrate-binding protein
MTRPSDDSVTPNTHDVGRRRVLQALGAASVAGLPAWSLAQPTAQIGRAHV